jgi:hypothetical protein
MAYGAGIGRGISHRQATSPALTGLVPEPMDLIYICVIAVAPTPRGAGASESEHRSRQLDFGDIVVSPLQKPSMLPDRFSELPQCFQLRGRFLQFRFSGQV